MAALRVAVIGYGLAGSVFHAPLIASTPGLELTDLVTSNPDRRARAERDFPGAEIHPSLESLLERASELQLVVVASPNRQHLGQALAALERGLNVVVDKPIALSVEEGERMALAAERQRLVLSVFQNRRLDNDFLLVRRLLAEGALGRLHHYESRFERWRPQLRPGSWREELAPEQGGGLLLDLGSHLIDQALVLFGPPLSVYAQLESRRESRSEDDCFLALHFRAGIMAHLWMSAVSPVPGPRFRLWGDGGELITHGLDPQEGQLGAGLRPGSGEYGAAGADQRAELLEAGQHEGAGRTAPLPPGRYQDFYQDVARAIVSGGPPPVPAAAAIEVMRVIEAARVSHRAGEPAPL